MIPVDQTMFYDASRSSGEQRGNCWTACIASLLELDIEAVPNFVQIDRDGGEHWWMHTLRWLRERNHTLVQHSVDSVPADRHVIRSGLSPRGTGNLYHAVLYLGGEMSHDPHFSRDGILSLSSIYEVAAA